MKTFVISDFHLLHRNIFKYSPSRLEIISRYSYSYDYLCELYDRGINGDDEALNIIFNEHEKALIKAWNSVVPKDGIVFILGDITLSKNKERLKNFFSNLNGTKHLIRGNHDILKIEAYLEIGISSVSNHPILYNKHIFLSHEPLPHEIIPEGYINFFGHVHERTDYNWERGRNVSVEALNYIPYEITREIGNFKH